MKPDALTGRTLLACALLAVPALTRAEQVVVPLHGFHEVPSVSSAARGRFVADIDRGGGSIRYELRYEALQGDVRQAHIHIGQRHTNGGISVFLCQTATNPDPTGLAPTCGPAPARVSGVLTAANVVGPTGQGVAAGEFAELVRAIRAGAAYVNVHSATFPGGEVRGQLGHGH
jgi:hypothetical protein